MQSVRSSIIYLIILLWGIVPESAGQYSGLRFNGHEVPLDQRTSLNLTPKQPIRIGDSGFDFSFDLKFEPDKQSYFGYIFRILIDGENIDFIYSPQSTGVKNFHLIIGERISNISFYVPLDYVTSQWSHVKLSIDGQDKSVTLQFNDSIYSDRFDQEMEKSLLHLFFGAHRYQKYNSTDLPGMNLCSVKLSMNGKLMHHWPLNQSAGLKVVDLLSNAHGTVTNPVWTLDLHSKWKMKETQYFDGRISSVYDNITNQLIIASKDSIFYENMDNGERERVLPNHYFQPNTDFYLVIDPVTGELQGYSADLGVKIFLTDSSRYTGEYLANSYTTNSWHHNKVINPISHVLFVFGGYGQLTYKNQLLRFNDSKHGWDTLLYSGSFHPRYLAGLGYNKRDNCAYIIGGYGSATGKQEINPGYYYDLIKYSFKYNEFTKVAEFDESLGDFCFSNSIYIDSVSNKLYGLKFSKYEANPKFQAVEISLDDFSVKLVGDPIEFSFLDINSNINLYIDKAGQTLYAVTSYFENDVTLLQVHEIAFPPVQSENFSLNEVESGAAIARVLIVSGVGFVVLILLLVYWRKRIAKKAMPNQVESSVIADAEFPEIISEKRTVNQEQSNRPGSILIFGGFQVISAKGEDITGSFTPLLKELFLFIMFNSLRQNRGVSSEKLNEIFWFDKSADSARNNRAVNLAKLRMLLENVGDCQISKETGYWKLIFDAEKVYIDYNEYLNLIGDVQNNNWSRDDLLAVLKIVRTGPALSNIDAEWLDDIKAEISNEIIDGILSYINRNGKNNDPEFIVQLTNCIFHFDMANEEAMIIKCKTLVSLGKHSLAKNAYAKFEKEYEALYGEKFSLTFNQVLSE